MIFWFLVAFGVVLLVAAWRWLPETHPPSARPPFVARHLVRDYLAIAANPRFQRLSAASAFNFGALFLYIASAPAFVLEMLRLDGQPLDERQFGWFFVPTIGGMVLGAFVSGRAAGRLTGDRLVGLGFAAAAVAMIGNLAYTFASPMLEIPWAVLPTSLHAFGIALVFPVITLAILDMYPRQRGSASSLQAFTSLVLNAIVAGVLSPWLTRDARWLACAAAAMVLVGWLFWRWEAGVSQRRPGCPEGMELPGEVP